MISALFSENGPVVIFCPYYLTTTLMNNCYTGKKQVFYYNVPICEQGVAFISIFHEVKCMTLGTIFKRHKIVKKFSCSLLHWQIALVGKLRNFCTELRAGNNFV